MKEIEIFSEKLNSMVKISAENSEEDIRIIMEDCDSSLAGWTHGGWNNDNGGAGW